MTILVDWEIRHMITSGAMIITPFEYSLVNPNSLDVRLGSEFLYYEDGINDPIDPYDRLSIEKGLCKKECNIIMPGEFLLGTTIEYISLPGNICCELNGKSSLARLGLEIHITGGWIDAGFEGQITLEMHNVNTRPILLSEGMPIGQLVIHRVSRAEKSYRERRGSKYCGQTGPVASRFHLNRGQI